jgi:serine/threonine protein kinase
MPSDPDPLSDPERAELSVRADQFHEALARGSVSDWEVYLAGLSARARPAVLAELVIIDLGHRWGRGERLTVEDYLRRFPDLGPAEKVPPKVILEELRCRLKAGERPDPAFYRDRFPAQYPAIRADLESAARAAGTVRPVESVVAPPPQPAGDDVVSVAQQYERVRVLGRGMFGEVWLARKKPSGIEKAIKILLQPADQDAAKRELRSLELIKNLRHPYLLATEDFWVADNRLYIVMELADYTLRGRLKQSLAEGQPGIPEDELFLYFQEAAEGLDYLHGKGVVHRDVKPDNILILNGHAKVADFGLARQQDALVASMSFAGTPAYMAPEVWGGEGGPASDLYSLAFAYAELRQGRPPLKLGPMSEMMFAHLDGLYEFAEFVPPAEQAVLRKAMSRTPGDRYPSCSAFIDDLARAAGRSVLRKSGRVGVPGSRILPALSGKAGATVVPASDPGHETLVPSAGAALSGLVQTQIPTANRPGAFETKTGSGTVTERPPVGSPRPRPGTKLILAGAVTFGLLGVLGGLIYLAVVGSGGTTEPTPRPTEPDIVKNGKGDGKTDDGKKDDGKKGNGGPGQKKDPFPLPAGAVPAAGATPVLLADGRRLHEWIVFPRVGPDVRLRLIVSAPGGPRVEPFYILESKVWNRQYRDWAVKNKVPLRGNELGGELAPVVNVTAGEAAAFAKAVFGGRLPSPVEWDHAAGFFDQRGQLGPTLLNGRPRVGLKEPAPTHGSEAGNDVNQFGLRDMAGNGREWTQGVLVGPGAPPRLVDDGRFDEGDLVIVRGRNYTLTRPLTYAMLDYEQTTPQTQFAGKPSAYTGFRVVVPVPGK